MKKAILSALLTFSLCVGNCTAAPEAPELSQDEEPIVGVLLITAGGATLLGAFGAADAALALVALAGIACNINQQCKQELVEAGTDFIYTLERGWNQTVDQAKDVSSSNWALLSEEVRAAAAHFSEVIESWDISAKSIAERMVQIASNTTVTRPGDAEAIDLGTLGQERLQDLMLEAINKLNALNKALEACKETEGSDCMEIFNEIVAWSHYLTKIADFVETLDLSEEQLCAFLKWFNDHVASLETFSWLDAPLMTLRHIATRAANCGSSTLYG